MIKFTKDAIEAARLAYAKAGLDKECPPGGDDYYNYKMGKALSAGAAADELLSPMAAELLRTAYYEKGRKDALAGAAAITDKDAAIKDLRELLEELVDLQKYAKGFSNGVEHNGVEEAEYWHGRTMAECISLLRRIPKI